MAALPSPPFGLLTAASARAGSAPCVMLRTSVAVPPNPSMVRSRRWALTGIREPVFRDAF
jgi:hypothetical protein